MTEPTDRVVIADTSGLVFAHVVDPDLLRRLYGRILVPEAVWEELEEGLREGQPGPNVPSTPWMEVRPTTLAPTVQAADANLGRGEAAVLSLALSLAPAQESLLYGVHENDPLTFVGIVIVLGSVALLACWIPGRQATRVDPMVAMRGD